MEINTIQRPSLLPAAVCAPSATWLPALTSSVITAAAPAQASQVHQVRIQAELAQVLVDGGAVYGFKGIAVFKGINVLSSVKRMTDGGSGTPPRGRPV